MWTIFYNQDGTEAGRLEGRRNIDDAPYPGKYTIRHMVTKEDVRMETRRRIMARLGARDAAHLDVLISNGSREAIRLLRKGKENWSAQEASRAAELDRIDAAIEAIRAAGNILEKQEPVPENFADDVRWNSL